MSNPAFFRIPESASLAPSSPILLEAREGRRVTKFIHFLRISSILLFLAILGPAIVQGAESRALFPSLGLIPAAGSAVLAIKVILHQRRIKLAMLSETRFSTERGVLLADVILFATHIAFMIASAVSLSCRGWHCYERHNVALGIYCLCIMSHDILIHGFIILAYYYNKKKNRLPTGPCSHCGHVANLTSVATVPYNDMETTESAQEITNVEAQTAGVVPEVSERQKSPSL